MAFISVNIPPPSLGYEVNLHEIQMEKSLGEGQKKMEESPTSSPRHMEQPKTRATRFSTGYEVKSHEIQLEKLFGEEQKKIEEKKIEESSTNAPQYTEFSMEMKQRRDKFSQIKCLLEEPLQCKIYRVHGHLRNINNKSYEPEVIAIGPYHRDKVDVKMMEEHKWRYFITLISGDEVKAVEYYSAIRPLEQVARNCYAEPISLNEAEFIKMLILDGCFIIELARKFEKKEYDSITGMRWMINSLQRDLVLFENQIPFFILCKLFDLIEGPDQHGQLIMFLTSFLYKICHVKEDNPLSYTSRLEINVHPDKIKHLLHLMHLKLVSSFEHGSVDHRFLVDRGRDLVDRVDKREQMRFIIKSATWLAKANVKFKSNEGARSMFNIKFKHGTLLLPTLRIGNATESVLRNLIAYEQYFKNSQNYVTDYVVFLDSLIDSSSDVEILSRFGIINNRFSDDEAAAEAFNKLAISVVISGDDEFIYGAIFDKLEEHCSKHRNRWMVNLRRNYLNSPWAIISVVVAIVLLFLTFLQTLFSGLSL